VEKKLHLLEQYKTLQENNSVDHFMAKRSAKKAKKSNRFKPYEREQH